LTIFVDCYAPAINFTDVYDYSDNSDTHVRSVFRSFECTNGYTIINSTSEIICYADGKWTPDTVCAKGNKKQMIARQILQNKVLLRQQILAIKFRHFDSLL
jgi:hypothetical protein